MQQLPEPPAVGAAARSARSPRVAAAADVLLDGNAVIEAPSQTSEEDYKAAAHPEHNETLQQQPHALKPSIAYSRRNPIAQLALHIVVMALGVFFSHISFSHIRRTGKGANKNDALRCVCALGMALAMCSELCPSVPHYNVVLFMGYAFFLGSKLIMEQSIYFFFTFVAISTVAGLYDLAFVVSPGSAADDGITLSVLRFARVMLALCSALKALFVLAILDRSGEGRRARKYIWRRVRTFVPPIRAPRKLTREVRARLLALEALHLAACIAYIVMLCIITTRMPYSLPFSENGLSLPVNAVLIIKIFSSFTFFAVLYTHTDTMMALAHFGLLCLCRVRVKRYILAYKDRTGELPLLLVIKPKTMRNLVLIKAADWLVGLLAWIQVSTVFGARFASIGYDSQVMVGAFTFFLALTDLWAVLLCGGIIWLLYKYKERRQEDAAAAEDSSDSELEELDMNTSSPSSPKQHVDEHSEEISIEFNTAHRAEDTHVSIPIPLSVDVTVPRLILPQRPHGKQQETEFVVDKSFVMSPQCFQEGWEQLRVSGTFRVPLLRTPDRELISIHLQSKGFHVVARGAVRNQFRLYSVGRAFELSLNESPPTSARRAGATCRLEFLMCSTPASSNVAALDLAPDTDLVGDAPTGSHSGSGCGMDLCVTFKCDDDRMTERFVQSLCLGDVLDYATNNP